MIRATSRSHFSVLFSAFCLLSLVCTQALFYTPAHAAQPGADEPGSSAKAPDGKHAAPDTAQIYWGAYINGGTYGYNDPPYDTRSIDAFESHTQKSMSILRWGQAWVGADGSLQQFDASDFNITRNRGYLPLINWNSWQSCCGANQPSFSLSSIISGTYDAYIREWATAAHNWGHPLFLQFDDEMNGRWYPWNEGVNGNSSGHGEYVSMWRHVHDIFTSVGATNVTWVWSANTEYDGSLPLEGLYPGDSYVDWTGINGYNWGTNPAKPDVWASFSERFSSTYNHILQLAPTKPQMIGEVASTEWGGSKAAWIADALSTQLPTYFPRVKAFVWYNWNSEGEDWIIESSPSSQAAFAAGIASPYFAANTFANYNVSPIAPPP